MVADLSCKGLVGISWEGRQGHREQIQKNSVVVVLSIRSYQQIGVAGDVMGGNEGRERWDINHSLVGQVEMLECCLWQ